MYVVSKNIKSPAAVIFAYGVGDDASASRETKVIFLYRSYICLQQVIFSAKVIFAYGKLYKRRAICRLTAIFA